MTNVKFFEVPSFSQKGIIHIVRFLLPEGEWRCNCKAFVLNEAKMRANGLVPSCDHIRRVRHQKMKHHGRKHG